MSGLPSTVTNESIVISYVPEKKMAHVTWVLCFRTQSVSKIDPFVTVLGQDCKVIDQHSYLIHQQNIKD